MPHPERAAAVRQAKRSVLAGMAVNGVLAVIKGAAGILGHSQALLADAIESASDVVASGVVYAGLKVAGGPPTESHPYGKGRAEPLAATLIGLLMLGASIGIVMTSIGHIVEPHRPPAPFTLVTLLAVIAVKEGMYRYALKQGRQTGSIAVEADAWHHRSDAFTSLAAFVGILMTLVLGPAFASADAWAALVAAVVIAVNAVQIMRPAVKELTDATPDRQLVDEVCRIACTVGRVKGTHHCWVRKHGLDYFVDLDVLVDGDITVRQGHDIAHEVHHAVTDQLPFVRRVYVHVEPEDDHGRFPMAWEQGSDRD